MGKRVYIHLTGSDRIDFHQDDDQIDLVGYANTLEKGACFVIHDRGIVINGSHIRFIEVKDEK